jgi:acyl-CoA synthetase (NDP forming)
MAAADLVLISDIVSAARAAGRETLLESEGLAILSGFGFHVPAHRAVRDAGAVDALDLDGIPGDSVVVKSLSPDIAHKIDVGALRFVSKDRAAIAEAIESMTRSLQNLTLHSFLVEERIAYDRSLGAELLLSGHWTHEFGSVVTLAPGGIYAELLAAGRELSISRSEGLDESAAQSLIRRLALSGPLLGGLRGQPPRIEPGVLIDVVTRFARLVRSAVPGLLKEIEINPLVVADGGAVALDVLARTGGRPAAPPEPERPLYKMANLLEPHSIALIGVSERMNPGHVILENLLRAGFERRRVHVVKRGREMLSGCRCYPDVRSLPERVDLLVLAVAAGQVPDLMSEVVETEKAESIILIPGGLDEKSGGEVLASRVLDVLTLSRSSEWGGPLVNGGNCMGIRSRLGRYDTTFIPEYKLPKGRPSPVAFISQSGAFFAAKLSKLGVDPKYAISLGNQMDLTLGDYMQYLKDDAELEVFAIYAEGFRPLDGARFLDAVGELAEGGKTVLLYRAGRTREGARASVSHTAAIAGDYVVTRELVASAGGIVCDTLMDFDDLLKLFVLLGPKPIRGRRLGALSNAGFECVAMADNLAPLELARFGADTVARLDKLLKDLGLSEIVDVDNPLDITPMAHDAGYAQALRIVLEDENVDVAIAGCVPLTPALQTLPLGGPHDEDMLGPDGLARRLLEVAKESHKPWVVAIDGGAPYDELARALEARAFPCSEPWIGRCACWGDTARRGCGPRARWVSCLPVRRSGTRAR